MSKAELVKTLERELRAAKGERQASPAMRAARTALKDYQSARLERTHAAALGKHDTRAAARFFLDELYGSHDLSQRDRDLERIIPTMRRMLSYEALKAITQGIVLDALSERMDSALAAGLGPDFSEPEYLQAYRTLSSRADRERQLALVQGLGTDLCTLVRVPFLSATLKVMRAPARLAGLGDLQAFLETGFTTFKAMRQPQLFVDTIVSRERAVMINVFDQRAQPYEID